MMNISYFNKMLLNNYSRATIILTISTYINKLPLSISGNGSYFVGENPQQLFKLIHGSFFIIMSENLAALTRNL